MVRVNVDERAHTDHRFRLLGKLCAADLGPIQRHALGLGLMIPVWRECTDRGACALPGAVLDGIADVEGFAEKLVTAGLAEKLADGSYRIRGAAGRVEWLEEKRQAGREHGRKGGRPRKGTETHTLSTETHTLSEERLTLGGGLGAETPLALAPVLAPVLALVPPDSEERESSTTNARTREAPMSPRRFDYVVERRRQFLDRAERAGLLAALADTDDTDRSADDLAALEEARATFRREFEAAVGYSPEEFDRIRCAMSAAA